MDSLGFSPHDHSTCISDAIDKATRHCAEAGVQLTPTRRRVLEILLEQHRAMGAYEILDILRADGLSAQPPVAYRALDFLVAQGFAHKIERLSAFVACAHPGEDHLPAFLICTQCEHVAEASADVPPGALRSMADAAGFAIDRTVVEATGTCPNCQGEAQ
ncbi:Fur family transcriptional regulator [Primorskyibacter sp. S187A]|uniref:Fur family transcriptional regulator n=1 Tax=Primorskyibacter sp. S187A TaxID=3415130 RepID=UPI003C7CB95B